MDRVYNHGIKSGWRLHSNVNFKPSFDHDTSWSGMISKNSWKFLSLVSIGFLIGSIGHQGQKVMKMWSRSVTEGKLTSTPTSDPTRGWATNDPTGGWATNDPTGGPSHCINLSLITGKTISGRHYCNQPSLTMVGPLVTPWSLKPTAVSMSYFVGEFELVLESLSTVGSYSPSNPKGELIWATWRSMDSINTLWLTILKGFQKLKNL